MQTVLIVVAFALIAVGGMLLRSAQHDVRRIRATATAVLEKVQDVELKAKRVRDRCNGLDDDHDLGPPRTKAS